MFRHPLNLLGKLPIAFRSDNRSRHRFRVIYQCHGSLGYRIHHHDIRLLYRYC